MDPYLEGPTHWSDFHHEFVGALRARINDILPEPYAARLGEYVVLEIDLQRAGPRFDLVKPLPSSDYLVYVWRSILPAVTDLYPWTVRDRFPVIKVPLKSPDPDVTLDLSIPFSSAFDRGRYDRFLKREELPSPPAFPAADMEWVLERHRQRS
jgi:hypothetical protein